MPTTREHDERALELRKSGKSFSAIASELGMDKASVAVEAFNRALRRLPAAQFQRTRAAELRRLDRLTARVKAETETEPEVLKERLGNINALRSRLLGP